MFILIFWPDVKLEKSSIFVLLSCKDVSVLDFSQTVYIMHLVSLYVVDDEARYIFYYRCYK